MDNSLSSSPNNNVTINSIVNESIGDESAKKKNHASIALGDLRLENRNGLIIAYLNINSIRNKIDFLRPMISETIDILIIAETKIDNTFPTCQFFIQGFMKPYRYDRTKNGGGLLIYARECTPVKELIQYKACADIECGVIEINLKKQKWLLAAIYRPPPPPPHPTTTVLFQ